MARRKADFSFKLDGAGKLEDLPLANVADLLRGLVVLIARGAAEELNRPIVGTGRWEGSVEQAAGIRLVGLRSGSVVADVVRPPATTAPGLVQDIPSLTDRALDRVFDVARGHTEHHPTVSAAFADVLDQFKAKPNAVIIVTDLRSGQRRRAEVKVSDRSVFRSAARVAAKRDMNRDVVGRLYEADLEAYTAKVRTPTNERIEVTFEADLAAEVQRKFGSSTQLRGEVVYDPVTNRAKAVRAREVLAGDQLALAGVDFWNPKSLAELTAEQGTAPIADPEALLIDEATDAEWEAFFGALGVGR